MHPQDFDPDLVDAARRGDEQALSMIARTSIPIVLGWAARLGGPTVDPEDAAHEVMLVLIDRVHSIRDPHRFGAWLFQVTRKVLARQRRRAWFTRWLPGASIERASNEPSPAELTLRSDLSRKVKLALEEMPSAQREVFVLCDIEEHTDLEAAELLEIPIGTVKSRLRLARERFREAARRLDIAPDLVEVASQSQ